jgi:hypothetical protein
MTFAIGGGARVAATLKSRKFDERAAPNYATGGMTRGTDARVTM